MSADGSVEIEWAGDFRKFRLAIDQLEALEDACGGIGCSEIFTRLETSRWGVRDVKETIRLGLLGGKTEGKIARRLVDEHVVDGKIFENVLIARAVLAAAIFGRPDDPVGKTTVAMEAPGQEGSPSPP